MINAFGLNSFGQTIPSNYTPNAERTLPADISRILYCTWESTFGTNYKGDLVVWGYDFQTGSLTSGLVPFKHVGGKDVVKIYGDPNSTIGILDSDGNIYHYNVAGLAEPVLVATDCKDVGCMASSQNVFLVKNDGQVYHTILSSREIPAKIEMPSVQGVEASFYHAIFYCKDPFAVYGTGSNRFGQLGTPESPEAHQPIPIAFFDGLAPAQFQVSCGTFQTSFVLDGDLYTCGLGTHHSQPNEDDGQGYLNLAEFRNDEGKECEVNVVKAVCGGKHIIAIDDQGNAWGIGNGKYGQLPRGDSQRSLSTDQNQFFQRLELNGNAYVVECWAGPQNSFLQMK